MPEFLSFLRDMAWIIIFFVVIGGGSGAYNLVRRWLDQTHAQRLQRIKHQHELELADKLDGIAKLLVDMDRMEDFDRRLRKAMNEQKRLAPKKSMPRLNEDNK